jgi:hypothetical protein
MNQKPTVISIPDAQKHLTSTLSLFRAGETEPLIIGAEGSPEAALIPYEQFQLLVEGLDPTVEKDFRELLAERGFSSLNEFMIHKLKADRAEKRRAQLKDVSERMWPNGAPKPGGES